MKKISKLKLNEISNDSLSTRQMRTIKGGNTCTCSCYWADRGGSSSYDNCFANHDLGDGYYSEHGDNGATCL